MGDLAMAVRRSSCYSQANGPDSNGLGIIAASKNRLSDCDGYYHASLHTSATAWYILAATKTDPFSLISGSPSSAAV